VELRRKHRKESSRSNKKFYEKTDDGTKKMLTTCTLHINLLLY
jgi:hypothetical protein